MEVTIYSNSSDIVYKYKDGKYYLNDLEIMNSDEKYNFFENLFAGFVRLNQPRQIYHLF